MGTYCTITPRPGAKHDPHTVPPKVWADPKVPIQVKRGMLGPWCYLYDGKVRSIFKPAAELPEPVPQEGLEPRPMPEGEAMVALGYFTPSVPGTDADETALVDLNHHEGDLEWTTAGPNAQTARCHLCNQQIPIADLSKHVVECLASGDDADQAPNRPLEAQDRAELMAEADRRGLDYPRNIGKGRLLQLLAADDAETEED